MGHPVPRYLRTARYRGLTSPDPVCNPTAPDGHTARPNPEPILRTSRRNVSGQPLTPQ
jgi:hypothetical protein